jgi:hypothetical protein
VGGRPSILTGHKISRFLLRSRLLDMGYNSNFDAGGKKIQFPVRLDSREWVKLIL